MNTTDKRARIERAARHTVAKIKQPDTRLADILDHAIATPAGGSLKNWVQEGMELDTVQVSLRLDEDGDPAITGAWQPGARIVEDVTATQMISGGSIRDFAGVITLDASPTHYVGGTVYNDTVTLIVFDVLS